MFGKKFTQIFSYISQGMVACPGKVNSEMLLDAIQVRIVAKVKRFRQILRHCGQVKIHKSHFPLASVLVLPRCFQDYEFA